MAFYDLVECAAAWLFNGESAGDNAEDLSTFGLNDLTDVGGTQVGRAAGGGPFSDDAADFTGGTLDTRLEKAEPLIFVDLRFNQWSITLWAKSDGAWGEVNERHLMGVAGASTPWLLKYSGDGKRFEFDLFDGFDTFTVFSDGSHAQDTWFYLVVTHDGINLRMYVDNVEVALGAVACGKLTQDTNDIAFTMGWDNDETDSKKFGGFLDEGSIFSRVLTEIERGQIFTQGLQGGFRAITNPSVDNTSPLAVGVGNVAKFSVIDTASITTEPIVDNASPLDPVVVDNKDPLEGVPNGGS